MTLRGLTKIFPDLIFTDCNQVPKLLRSPFVTQHFNAIQVMLHMVVWIYNDPSGTPFANRFNESFLFSSRNKVIKRSKRPVAIAAQLGIGMQRIIKKLIFQADG